MRIIVKKVRGKWEVIEGHRKLEAAKNSDQKTIDAVDIDTGQTIKIQLK